MKFLEANTAISTMLLKAQHWTNSRSRRCLKRRLGGDNGVVFWVDGLKEGGCLLGFRLVKFGNNYPLGFIVLMNFIPERVQEEIFSRVCSLEENKECADCSAKHPSWSSIDFGVLICMKCAGRDELLWRNDGTRGAQRPWDEHNSG